MIETKRIKMYPASREQMEEIIALEPCEELKVAYSEMLEGCLQHIDEWEWYAMWNIELNNGTRVGDLCFKGLDSKGVVEIGYGILEEYQGQGYASVARILMYKTLNTIKIDTNEKSVSMVANEIEQL